MNELTRRILRFLRSEDGPTAVEYALMILLVFLAVISTVVLLGEATNSCFEYSRDEIEKAVH
jgi:pilus assembly protein Flp/PilA